MAVVVRLVVNATCIVGGDKILASLEQAECSVLKEFSLKNCDRSLQ